MRPRPHGRPADLMNIAAAVVGSAAATQLIRHAAPVVCCESHEDVEAVQCCDDCPDAEDEAERLDVHEALNTYEVYPDLPAGVTRNDPQVNVIGDNRRRLIVQRMHDGVWIGGCKVTSRDDLIELASVLAEWAGELS